MSAEMQNAKLGESSRIVSVPAGSVSLDGELAMPPEAGGIVLCAHAGGGHGPRQQRLAQLLRQAGLGTLLLDLFTPREERADAERGNLCFNIGLLTQRLVCAAHWLGGEDEARHQRLGFCASSTAAGAALVAAADLGRTIGAVVSLGGRPDLAGGALRRVKCPTLLLVGERDEPIIEFNEEARDLLACERELRLVPDASHHFEEPGAVEEAARHASDWFLNHLGASSGSRLRR